MAAQGNQDRGGTVEVRYAFDFDEAKDCFRIDTAQANVGATDGCHAPGKTPAIAVKHGEGPEIRRAAIEADFQRFAQGIEISAPVGVHDAFGIARGAAGVIDADRLIFIAHRLFDRRL
jgi:hypothetical protein